MMKVIFLSILLLALAFLALAISILLKKDGKFPVSQIGHNKAIRKKGIECPQTMEMKAQREARKMKRKKVQSS
jgi:hypothetical protein